MDNKKLLEELEEIATEDTGDVISINVPLLMRLLEWSREDAKEDRDLHFLVENLIKEMQVTDYLTMDNYDDLVPYTKEVEDGE